MTRDGYRQWRAETAAAYRADARNGAPYQRCSRCGKCEYAGGFCSWCRTAEYTLTAHRHVGEGERCRTGRPTTVRSEGGWLHPSVTSPPRVVTRPEAA